MTLTRLSPIDGEAILPLADAKLHLRVTHDDEDSLIALLRDSAIAHVERVSGKALAPAQFRWTQSCFTNRIALPAGPVVSVDEVSYYDSAGEPATYTGARLISGDVFPATGDSWPTSSGYVSVNFTAGFVDPGDAPDLLAAVMLMLGHLNANREAVNIGNITSELPLGVAALIGSHRQVLV